MAGQLCLWSFIKQISFPPLNSTFCAHSSKIEKVPKPKKPSGQRNLQPTQKIRFKAEFCLITRTLIMIKKRTNGGEPPSVYRDSRSVRSSDSCGVPGVLWGDSTCQSHTLQRHLLPPETPALTASSISLSAVSPLAPLRGSACSRMRPPRPLAQCSPRALRGSISDPGNTGPSRHQTFTAHFHFFPPPGVCELLPLHREGLIIFVFFLFSFLSCKL